MELTNKNKLEYFMAAALTGILANQSSHPSDTSEQGLRRIANDAYAVADMVVRKLNYERSGNNSKAVPCEEFENEIDKI